MVVFQIGSQKFPWFLLLELHSHSPDTKLDQQFLRCCKVKELFEERKWNKYLSLEHNIDSKQYFLVYSFIRIIYLFVTYNVPKIYFERDNNSLSLQVYVSMKFHIVLIVVFANFSDDTKKISLERIEVSESKSKEK